MVEQDDPTPDGSSLQHAISDLNIASELEISTAMDTDITDQQTRQYQTNAWLQLILHKTCKIRIYYKMQHFTSFITSYLPLNKPMEIKNREAHTPGW